MMSEIVSEALLIRYHEKEQILLWKLNCSLSMHLYAQLKRLLSTSEGKCDI